MLKISSKEFYTDCYGTQAPQALAAETWGFEEEAGDFYYASEYAPLEGVESGRMGARPEDAELIDDIGAEVDDMAQDRDEVPELAKALTQLKNDIRDEKKSEALDDETKDSLLAKADEISEKLLGGKVDAEAVQDDLDSLRGEWEQAVETAAARQAESQEGLSKPSHTDKKSKTDFYDSDPTIVVKPNYDDAVEHHEITAGTATLPGATLNDSFVVTFDEADGVYLVEVTGKDKKKNPHTETFRVNDAQLDKLIIPSNQVDVSQLSDEQLAKLRIGTDPKSAREKVEAKWPESGIESLIPNSDNSDYARRLAKKIDAAATGKGSWEDAKSCITTWYRDGGIGGDSVSGYNAEKCIDDENYMNDVVRKVVTAIYRASHATRNDDPRFLQMLQKMPQDFRRILIDWVGKEVGEGTERQGGEQWNSVETAQRLQDSIDLENGKGDETKDEGPKDTKNGGA